MERNLYGYTLKDYWLFNTDGTDNKGINVYDINGRFVAKIEGEQLELFCDEEENELWDYIKDYL